MKSDNLPIFERFTTFQGEGVFMGLAAFFIRTHGCPVHCPWCDSAGTWHPDWKPKQVSEFDVKYLADEAEDSQAGMVVVTGGEPTIYDLSKLCDALHERKLSVHLETSGAVRIHSPEKFDWVTLSPKKWKMPLPENYALAQEFKVIVEEPADIDFYVDKLMSQDDGEPPHIWLHPEWSHREDPVVLGAISEAVKEGPSKGRVLRAGWQLHKLYRVDLRDTRIRGMVPLGGDLTKGY